MGTRGTEDACSQDDESVRRDDEAGMEREPMRPHLSCLFDGGGLTVKVQPRLEAR